MGKDRFVGEIAFDPQHELNYLVVREEITEHGVFGVMVASTDYRDLAELIIHINALKFGGNPRYHLFEPIEPGSDERQGRIIERRI